MVEGGAAEKAGDVITGVGGIEVGETEGDAGEEVGVGVGGAGVGVEGRDAVVVVAGLVADPPHELRLCGGRVDGEDGEEEAEEREAERWKRSHFLGAAGRSEEEEVECLF